MLPVVEEKKCASSTMNMPVLGTTKHSKLALVGGALAAASALSVVCLTSSLRRETGVVILWLGWLSLGLIVASALCLLSALAAFLQTRKKTVSATVEAKRVRIDHEYLAEYSRADRAVALGIAIFFAALTSFFVFRSANWKATSLSSAFLCWSLFHLIHVTFTRVTFTDSGLAARLPWRRPFSKPYDEVKRIVSKPGTLKVEFSDGRSLGLHPGVGSADVVISFLQTHCSEQFKAE